ncbi:hypothetical protein PQX77_012097 [Marasmius sp. AFHP31]|nr:hypothetical protein PQX77_012097 [Marasmius sp. AFHP31]
MSRPFAKAGLIGTLLESIIYGIYLTVFLRTSRILRRKVFTGFGFAYLTTTTLILFVLITMRLAVDIHIMVQTLTVPGSGPIPNALELQKLSCGIYVSLTIIADIFIVYRVFALWSRSLVVSAIPCSLIVAGIASGGLLVASLSDFGSDEPRNLFINFYCITLVLNVLCTVLIASKLYISDRQTTLSSSLRLKWTSVIVIESAALYSACVIIIVVCNVLGADDINLIFLLAIPSIIGLTFSSIIVRVAGSGETPNKTFTSIGIDRSSVLLSSRQLWTVGGGDIEMGACLNGQSSKKPSVATITAATVQVQSSPRAPMDNVEKQLTARETSSLRQSNDTNHAGAPA